MNKKWFEHLPVWLIFPFAVPALLFDGFRTRSERRRWPSTVDEAVQLILKNKSAEEIERLVKSSDDVWFTLGQDIRNDFGLWLGNDALIESCGVVDSVVPADAACAVIIEELTLRFRSLNEDNESDFTST